MSYRHEKALGDFLAFLDEVTLDARQREAAYAAWLDDAMPTIAAELTAELIPEDMRAAGIRFEWAAEER